MLWLSLAHQTHQALVTPACFSPDPIGIGHRFWPSDIGQGPALSHQHPFHLNGGQLPPPAFPWQTPPNMLLPFMLPPTSGGASSQQFPGQMDSNSWMAWAQQQQGQQQQQSPSLPHLPPQPQQQSDPSYPPPHTQQQHQQQQHYPHLQFQPQQLPGYHPYYQQQQQQPQLPRFPDPGSFTGPLQPPLTFTAPALPSSSAMGLPPSTGSAQVLPQEARVHVQGVSIGLARTVYIWFWPTLCM
jgi:hypothetical protein